MQRNRAASRVEIGRYEEERVIAAAKACRAELDADVSVGFVFVTADFGAHLPEFLELIRVYGRVPLLLGCSGSGLIGTALEEEEEPGFSLLLLSLPRTKLTACEISQHQVEESTGPGFWHMETGVTEPDAWLVFAHPARLAVDQWLRQWDEAYARIPTVGGLASGGEAADEIFLLRDGGQVERADALALALEGGVRVTPIVSQGCRPIGEPLTITGARQNLVLTLASRPAYEVLDTVFRSLDRREQERATGNLFAGLAVSEYLEDFKRGDFLIRNILGADPSTGVVAIGAQPRIGQTLQYQLRDRDTADEDLRELCHHVYEVEFTRPFAHLLFSCTGRGRGLFRIPHHDAGILAEVFGPRPSAGFFCNGEIGPVGPRTFLHGYTASAALLCEP
ncbi:MAG: FIST C-terminal domain-containing protein [Verrucomicrobia bacterium]|nr:FIST C-terminal domain-containing protein [Verrucomicrobiota bacterium]